MKRIHLFTYAGLALGLTLGWFGHDILRADTKPAVQVANLLREDATASDGIELIVSRIEIPPATTLPKHWHPGDEVLFLLDGAATIWQKDKPDSVLKPGQAFHIPMKQLHTGITGSESAKALVFRVHRKGEPVAVNAEE